MVSSVDGASRARGLAITLVRIKKADTVYAERYPLVFRAVAEALDLGYAAGVRLDPNQPEWPVLYIELPEGQVSWHVPQHPVPWDGHTTEDKYRIIDDFAAGQLVGATA